MKVAGCAALAYNAFMPKENDELNQAPKSASGRQGKTLNVRAVVVEQQLLTDGLSMSGSLVPDEEVSLSFETSGKITDIFFKEGSMVEKGQLLAKINDAPLQAELLFLAHLLKRLSSPFVLFLLCFDNYATDSLYFIGRKIGIQRQQ